MTKIPTNVYKKLAALGATGAMVLAATVLIPSEGYVDRVYPDPVQILTSCFGHTGPELRMGQRFTEAQCLNQLVSDLHKHDREMMREIDVPIPDHVHAAFLSFCYNIGVSKCAKSTAFRLLNENKIQSACNEMPRWVYARGKLLPGLVERRKKERALCLGAVNAQ